jgi:5-methyltetrahydropteroyltriglutamate--homocysteine methyltransferase
MNDRVIAYQHGIYPRSEDLVAATRGLERARASQHEVDQRIDADLADFVRTQRDAGLDCFSDGLLRWQDIFRPLVGVWKGVDAHTLVRWFDNNSFFRAPEITERPSVESNLPAVFDSGTLVPEPRLATLPSPYLFSRAADTQRNRNDLMRELARYVLRPVVEGLAERGYRVVHLQEPWLTFFGIEPGDWAGFEEALQELLQATAANQMTLVLHTYFGNALPVADRLRRMPVDAVGVDLVGTDHDALKGTWETGLLLGCLDGRSSTVEPLDGSVRLVRQIADALEPSAVYLSSNCELEFLPREVAKRKVLRLGEIARHVRETP